MSQYLSTLGYIGNSKSGIRALERTAGWSESWMFEYELHHKGELVELHVLLAILTKGSNFCNFLFSSVDGAVLPKWGLLLITQDF